MASLEKVEKTLLMPINDDVVAALRQCIDHSAQNTIKKRARFGRLDDDLWLSFALIEMHMDRLSSVGTLEIDGVTGACDELGPTAELRRQIGRQRENCSPIRRDASYA